MHTGKLWVLIGSLLLLQACASKLRVNGEDREDQAEALDPSEEEVDSDLPKESGKFTNSARRDGSIVTTADASLDTEWQKFDFDTGEATDDDDAWDIEFSRFRIRTNGGVSGPGGVYVAQCVGEAYADVTRAPSKGFAADRDDSAEDTDTLADNAFNSGAEDWYDYKVMTHELSPKKITYVVASSEERFYKLAIESYYDRAGTPGLVKFRWEEIDAPESGWPPPERETNEDARGDEAEGSQG